MLHRDQFCTGHKCQMTETFFSLEKRPSCSPFASEIQCVCFWFAHRYFKISFGKVILRGKKSCLKSVLFIWRNICHKTWKEWFLCDWEINETFVVMYNPEIIYLVQKGIRKKAGFCLFSPECLGWDSKKIFCISKTSWVCALSYGAEVDVFRNWILGLEEHWGFLCPDLMKEPCLGLLFRSVNCLLGWVCLILFGEQELEAVQPLGCLAGGWGWCSLWAPILGRQTPLYMVTLWWFVLLAFFSILWSPWK